MKDNFNAHKTRGGKKAVFLMLAVFIIGSLIRLVPWANFITPEGIYLLEGDNYEHLRKIILILNDFPYPPVHDFYIGFPEGTGAIWAPLLDITLAVLVKTVNLLTGAGAETVTAALPAPVGMLAAIFLFLWVREIFGATAGLASALVLALLPSHIFTTIIGRPDNELIEPVFAALTFYLHTRACGSATTGAGGASGTGGALDKQIILSGLLTGLSLAASLLFWRGALMWWAIIGAHTLLMLLYHGFKGPGSLYRRYFTLGAATFTAAAIVIALVTSTGLWGTKAGVDFNTVSTFHVISALVALLSLLAAYFGFYLHYEKGFTPAKAAPPAVIILLVTILLLHLAVPAYIGGIISGAAVVGGGEGGWIGTIAEYQPLFHSSGGGVLDTILSSSILIIIAPLLIIILAVSPAFRRLATGRDINAAGATGGSGVKNSEGAGPSGGGLSFFLLSGTALFILTLKNGRYENVFTLFEAVSAGVICALTWSFVIKKKGVITGALAGGAVIVLMLLPSVAEYVKLPRIGPVLVKGGVEEAMKWIRANTPETSHYLTPTSRPEYGVMARWEYSAWIEHIARRPSVATIFGIETHGLKESAAFFLSTDDKEAVSILDDNLSRYVIVTKTLGALGGYATLLGRDARDYAVMETGEDGARYWQTGPDYIELVYARLLLTDGEGLPNDDGIKKVDGFRLVYESGELAGFAPPFNETRTIKVFERVKGAVIRGTSEPGSVVTISAKVLTNQGRTIPVERRTRVDNKGRYALKAYYPELKGGLDRGRRTGTVGGYTVTTTEGGRGVLLSEEDVLGGV